LRDADGAMRNWESARDLDPSAAAAPAALARLYAQAGRAVDAARAEEQAAAFETEAPARAARLLCAGDHLARGHRPTQALPLYQAAAAVDQGGELAGGAAAAEKAAKLGDRVRDPARYRAELLERSRRIEEPEDRLTVLRQLLALGLEGADAAEVDL